MSRVADQSLGILVQRESLFCALDLSFRNLKLFEASADWIRHEQTMDFTILTQELTVDYPKTVICPRLYALFFFSTKISFQWNVLYLKMQESQSKHWWSSCKTCYSSSYCDAEQTALTSVGVINPVHPAGIATERCLV